MPGIRPSQLRPLQWSLSPSSAAAARHRLVPCRWRHRRGSCGTRASPQETEAGRPDAWATLESALVGCCRGLSTGGEGGKQLREAEGGATVRDRSTEERRDEGMDGCVAGCSSERRKDGEVLPKMKGPVVSCSHPERSATILGETRISQSRTR